MYLVITKNTLSELLGHFRQSSDWTPIPKNENLTEAGFISSSSEGFMHILSLKDLSAPNNPRLFINLDSVQRQERSFHHSLFQRIEKFSEITLSPGGITPKNWKPYHHQNLISFFATSNSSASGARWICEIVPTLNQPDIVFRDISTPENHLELETYPMDRGVSAIGRLDLTNALRDAESYIKGKDSEYGGVIAHGVTLLNDIGSRVVAKHKSFDEWIGLLTTAQRAFVLSNTGNSMRIYGPAGSGKTLCLALFAIAQARLDKKPNRIGFLTQNWSQAYMIDSLLQVLDPIASNSVHTYPLSYLAGTIFPEGADISVSGFELMAEDSVSGKRSNLDYVKKALLTSIASDLTVVRPQMSDLMQARIELAKNNELELNTLVWDVMNEIASVLAVNRIRPGLSAATRYRSLPRARWMMPLNKDGDKDFILAVYTRYVSSLEEAHLISYDQLLSDYISRFDTFEWDRRRAVEGYNVILVDEYHLYTDIERSLIAFLHNNPNTYPNIVIAADPLQSPTDVFNGLEFAASVKPVKEGETTGVTDESLFNVFTRYSVQIEDLVRHVYNSYPTLISNNRLVINEMSTPSQGDTPTYLTHASSVAACEYLANSQSARKNAKDSTNAIICTNIADMEVLKSSLDAMKVPYIPIESSADFDLLKYSRKKLIIGYVDNVAGLQFDHVSVLCNSWGSAGRGGQELYSNRIQVSRLYSALTRATNKLDLHITTNEGEFPSVIQRAIDKGLIQLAPN